MAGDRRLVRGGTESPTFFFDVDDHDSKASIRPGVAIRLATAVRPRCRSLVEDCVVISQERILHSAAGALSRATSEFAEFRWSLAPEIDVDLFDNTSGGSQTSHREPVLSGMRPLLVC